MKEKREYRRENNSRKCPELNFVFPDWKHSYRMKTDAYYSKSVWDLEHWRKKMTSYILERGRGEGKMHIQKIWKQNGFGILNSNTARLKRRKQCPTCDHLSYQGWRQNKVSKVSFYASFSRTVYLPKWRNKSRKRKMWVIENRKPGGEAKGIFRILCTTGKERQPVQTRAVWLKRRTLWELLS